jgi:hypothetical protein
MDRRTVVPDGRLKKFLLVHLRMAGAGGMDGQRLDVGHADQEGEQLQPV